MINILQLIKVKQCLWACTEPRKTLDAKGGNKWDNFFLALWQDGHRFLQVMSHFRGFEPHLRRYFFYEIWYQMGFFTYFDILESYVINLRGQDHLKTSKFVQEISKIAIAIYLCSIMYYTL